MLLPWFKCLIPGFAVVTTTVIWMAPTQAQPTGFDVLEDFDYWTDLCRLQADAKDYENALAA
ncbi:MAG: hypothetical protein AAGA46_02250, partial [Cyanobacteria bacterium P01_F01_bin.13]